ncbi:MAG: hypothetical protein M1829_001125 [Trizodia sp. TS-e1964]|nr:MAG: hypothetical protein M1829_001125 [Trizodia sp. TS-e1964]
MAYRKYYASMLPSLQQREISVLLAQLCKEDPFKNKWHLVARALSFIREIVGRTNSPLDAFLDIVCPYIGILSDQEYTQKLGWTLSVDDIGDLTFVQDPASIDQTVFNDLGVEHHAVRDLVNLALAAGYVSDLHYIAEIEALVAARGEAGEFDAANYTFMDPAALIRAAQQQQKREYQLLLDSIEQYDFGLDAGLPTGLPDASEFNPNLITEANSAIFDHINIDASQAQNMLNQMIGSGLTEEEAEIIGNLFADGI